MEEEHILLEEEKEFKRFYRVSLWWVEHRVLLRRIVYGICIAFDVVLWSFVLWTFLSSFLFRASDEQLEVAKLAVLGQQDLHAYTVSHRAEDVLMSTIRVFPLGTGRYDFYTEVTNPNADWWVEFDYQFLYSSGTTVVTKGFLLPGQQKPLVALAVNSSTPVTQAQIELTNIFWHRIDHHQIVEYETWQQDRLNISIINPVFTQETSLSGDLVGRTTFTVKNTTAFSYADPEFYVLLKKGSSVVGVNRATVTSLLAGEETEIVLNWFGVLPSVTSVEVLPDIELFDVHVYLKPVSESSLDTRTINQSN